MRYNARKTNSAVMYGVMGMAVVVLLVVLMFLNWMGAGQDDVQDIDDVSVETENLQ